MCFSHEATAVMSFIQLLYFLLQYMKQIFVEQRIKINTSVSDSVSLTTDECARALF